MFRKLSIALLTAGFVLGGTATALACPGAQAKMAKKAERVDVGTLATWIEKKESKVFHAASEETFAAGTLPTAERVDYKAMTADTLGANKNAKMTFLCANTMCSASKKAAMAAIDMGYDNVWVFKGGVDGWKAAGHQLVVADKAKKVKADG